MTGKLIRSLLTQKNSEQYEKLIELQNKSIYELNHFISKENSKLNWIPKLVTEFVIVNYPTVKEPNGIDIDLLKVLENRGEILNVSTMGPPQTQELKILLDCWNECTYSRVKENQIRFYLEENLSQDFYIDDINSLNTTDLEYEFNNGNIESILVDEIDTLDSNVPMKFIIGVKQKGNNFQPFYFNPTPQSIKLRTIG